MVGNWRERKESGVDMKEGAIKVSVLKAVLFLWRGLKPPDQGESHVAGHVESSAQEEKVTIQVIFFADKY